MYSLSKKYELLSVTVSLEMNLYDDRTRFLGAERRTIYRAINVTPSEVAKVCLNFETLEPGYNCFSSRVHGAYGVDRRYVLTVDAGTSEQLVDLFNMAQTNEAKNALPTSFINAYEPPPLNYRGTDHLTSHVLFLDESNHNRGRFRSMSLVKVARAAAHDIDTALRQSVRNFDKLSYKELRTARIASAANSLVDILVPFIREGALRITTIVWDACDHRHDICGRNDTANFRNILCQLLNNLGRNTAHQERWRLLIDSGSPLASDNPRDLQTRLNRYCPSNFVDSVRHTTEDEHPILRIADLFAGLSACFANTDLSRSSSGNARRAVVKHLHAQLKQLGIDLATNEFKVLKTRPNDQVSFWPYTPRRNDVRAPTRDPFNH